MVLANYGQRYTEAELYNCCETDVDGTLPSAAARCAQQLGFSASAERLPDLETLIQRAALATPIVFLNLAPLLGITIIHAVVVVTIDRQQEQITVLDPAHPPDGHRTWGLGLFQIGWHLARNQAILIKQN